MANVIARVYQSGMMTPYLQKLLERGVSPDKRKERLGTMEVRVHPQAQQPPLQLRLSPLPLSLLRSRLLDVQAVRVRFQRRKVMFMVTSILFR